MTGAVEGWFSATRRKFSGVEQILTRVEGWFNATRRKFSRVEEMMGAVEGRLRVIGRKMGWVEGWLRECKLDCVNDSRVCTCFQKGGKCPNSSFTHYLAGIKVKLLFQLVEGAALLSIHYSFLTILYHLLKIPCFWYCGGVGVVLCSGDLKNKAGVLSQLSCGCINLA